MAWRLLLGLLIGYLAYRLVKNVYQSWTTGGATSRRTQPNEPEELVKDPVCGTFIPRANALKLHQDGQDYFFCSEGCLKRFRRSGMK